MLRKRIEIITLIDFWFAVTAGAIRDHSQLDFEVGRQLTRSLR
jgi:hypothetical protein